MNYENVVPCEPNPECKYFEAGCREDTHHLYYPKHEYTTVVERLFRDLATNKQLMCRRKHEVLHSGQLPPEKPDREEMEQAIDEAHLFLSRRARKALYK